MRKIRPALSILAALAAGGPAAAGEADVLAAEITRNADGTHDITVTVRHADTGWEHFADRWEVLDAEGAVLARRVLAHPHVDEQPFTRTLRRAQLPNGVAEVTIRAHDSLDGYGGAELTVMVPD